MLVSARRVVDFEVTVVFVEVIIVVLVVSVTVLKVVVVEVNPEGILSKI